MKKVGIITMYYGSKNYGGVLQAYALQKAISNLGYECEQISFKRTVNKKLSSQLKNRLEVSNPFEVMKWATGRSIKLINSKIAKKVLEKQFGESMKIKNDKFTKYCERIPHSVVYTSDDIEKSIDVYDTFVCGSDQIWKPGVACKEYLLGFVPENKNKVSYAASISKNTLSKEESEFLTSNIERFDSVSVREKQAVKLLNKYTNKQVEWVLDPTLLLSREQWEKECSEKLVNEKYIFCYLLGVDKKQRIMIEKLAKTKDMKIVTIPFSNGSYNFVDSSFGDIKFGNAGPNDFLSLIKYASLVITDSFHATVFSNIFETDFYVLERTEEKTMNSRITSLLDVVGLPNRFISNCEDLLEYKSINFSNKNDLENKIKNSKIYLENSLK